MKFTDKAIKALRPKAARYEVWEGGGFGVRVSPTGRKTWVWVYHFGDHPRRMTLGNYEGMALADARVKLAAAQKLLAQGIDPGRLEVDSKKAERAAETVAELIEAYLKGHARPRKRSAGEDERILNKDVRPAWGRRKAKAITRKDVIALLDKIVERGAPIAANRTLATIRKMFGWALSRDLVTDNPCKGAKAPADEKRRDRILDAGEIASLWAALSRPDIGVSLTVRHALKLLLVTIQRRGEVASAERLEFDTKEAIWTIPASKAKNGMTHRVPLSALAVELLIEIKAERAKAVTEAKTPEAAATAARLAQSRWLFPSPRLAAPTEDNDGTRPITGQAIDHAMRKAEDKLGTGDATPHDLRRTGASHMTSMGITRLAVSKILNHAEPGITAVYDRHSYDPEKRHALEAWGSRLAKIIAGEEDAEATNVVVLHA